MDLPSKESAFDFDHTGTDTGKRYEGQFKVLCLLDMGQKHRLELEKTRLLGNHPNPTDGLAGISIILASPVMVVLRCRRVRGQFFEPNVVVVKETLLGIIDKYRGSNVHGVDEAKPFPNPALAHQIFDSAGDINKSSSSRHLEPKLFPETFHSLGFANPRDRHK